MSTITLSLCAVCASAQDRQETGIDLQRIAEELLVSADADANYEEIYENLGQTLASPLDLNTVTAEELRSLNLLTDAEIDSLLAYRTAEGPLMDVYELQVIPGFDTTAISKLLPFVRIADPSSRINRSLLSRVLSPGHSYLITRYERTLEKKRGFKPPPGSAPAYQGSEDKLYFRFRASIPGDFSIGVTGEKDAGEKLTFDPRRNQWAFDFASWHVQLRNKGRVKNLIAGDFQSQFGQGLLLGGAFGLGKGGESVATFRKPNVGFQPYTSAQENAYHRGIAVTITPRRALELSAFYSRALRDASNGGHADTAIASALQSTGYHRTLEELMNRKKLVEQNTAMIVRVHTRATEAGLIVNYLHFDQPLSPFPTPYNQFAFRGVSNGATGIFVNHRVRNFSFFSEAARSTSGGWAGIGGVLISAHQNLELSLVIRNYTRNFHTFYSNALSENTHPQNERAICWGWKYQWNQQYGINGYLDLFEFPWLSFRRYKPSQGHDWLLRAVYKPSRKTSLVLQWKQESKAFNLRPTSNLYRVENCQRERITFHCDINASDHIRLKSRIQYNASRTGGVTTEGWLLVQDIIAQAGRFQISARHAIFDTDHYDNRHYVYENDAWLAYSLPAYSGVGVRNYVLFEYKINKSLTFWLRYARTLMRTGGEIGSGQDSIDGNTKNDVKFQARFKF